MVSGQHRDGGDATVAGGLDVMRHIADERGLLPIQPVGLDDEIDQLPFIEDSRVGFLEEILHTEFMELPEERIGVH